MAHGVTGRVQRLELDSLADLDDIPGTEPARHARDLVLRVLVREDLGAGLRNHRIVPAGVVAMLVRVQDLRDGPALILRSLQALLVVQRVDRQGLTGLRADDQVIEVSVSVCGPDLLDDHGRNPV